jgi:anhydro-N-acetylmuramic acid kinase
LKSLSVIGLNSGTSMDGIDAALFRIVPSRLSSTKGNGSTDIQQLEIEMQESLVYPFEGSFKKKLLGSINSGKISLDDICRLNVALGETFAEAALSLIKAAGITRKEVDLIGSHGQTIWHAPNNKSYAGIKTHGTLQLGEPAIIAERTGITTIADFRQQDMAQGGQGAPLTAFADQVLFGSSEEPIGIQNIGGIANITVLDNHGQAAMAFDSGPGNMIIDHLVKILFNQDYDVDGKIASSGNINDELIAQFMTNDYFLLSPPKTTGRELFGTAFANEFLQKAQALDLNKEDIIASATAFTAFSIAHAYKTFIEPNYKINRLILGGGGTYNFELNRLIAKYWPHSLILETHEDYGISVKFKEALLFALLAYTTNFGIPNNVPTCTGAAHKVCLGKICRP